MNKKIQSGQLLVELLLTIGLAAVIIPGLMTGILASREARPSQEQRVQAVALLKETSTAVRSARDNDWNTFVAATSGAAYHPIIASNKWVLSPNATTSAGFTQQVILNDVSRDTNGNVVTTGGTNDPSTKRADITISWTKPTSASITTSLYLTRTTNLTSLQTSEIEFKAGTTNNTQVTNITGGEVKLANNNKAKWCSPAYTVDINGNAVTIDLPDGPPVAVAATASATSINIPNDVFVATAPYATSSVKLAYVNVTANTATPSATLKGTFTLDATKYSSGTYPTSLGGLTNSFATNDVKYYMSASGKLYGLLATTDPGHEVVVVQIKSGGTDSYQDPTNKIYKYWTYFNTKINSTVATNDQAPFGYGAISVAVLGTRGYIISGGFLYVFDLSNIDTATTTTSLPMVGCRIQLDGYDCKPGTGQDNKYGNGNTGTTYSSTATPAHNDCSDGGNIELHADNDIFPVKVGTNTYVYVAVGAGTNPEFNIANVTTVPTGSSLTNTSTCGISSSSWKKDGSLDFNTLSGTEEAANSVYANADGSRAYVSSNGGIDANGDGKADSDQFYIVDTSSKTAPKFLSTSSSGTGNIATSGYYNGASPAPSADSELFPRRSLTVLNGQRAVLVGKDGFTNGNNAEEYQVLNTETEAAPTYCSGLNFDQGFNDLTSVSELDNENYVYMVANTNAKQLKIIEGGPDSALFVPSGTFESSAFDTASVGGSQALRAFNRFFANIIQPNNTSISIQTAVTQAVGGVCPTTSSAYTFLGDDGTTTKFATASGSTISSIIPLLNVGNFSNPGRCFKYKAYLSTTDQTKSPELDDIYWNYSQ